MTPTIPKLQTGYHFLDLSEMCLYMVHFCLGPFFSKITKKCLSGVFILIEGIFFLIQNIYMITLHHKQYIIVYNRELLQISLSAKKF